MTESDPWDLGRFVEAQAEVYADALAEVRAGHKRGHWMWFVFPQLAGLGFSERSQHYGLSGREEAAAYLAHPVLGERLRACCEAVLESGRTAEQIFGPPDDLKLRSCVTLFASVSPVASVFHRVLEVMFGGEGCPATLRRLGSG